MDSAIFTGTYKDEANELPISVENNFSTFTAIINDLQFSSSDMEEWTLSDEDGYDESKLDSLSVSTTTVKESFNLVTKYLLTDCTLSFSIPQKVLNKQTAEETVEELKLVIKLSGNPVSIDLKMEIGEDIFSVENNLLMEEGLAKLNKSMDRKYILFNCFNCRYSSYSVYGQSTFGSLLCYKKYKDRFLKIKDKSDYTHVESQGYETVQETFDCVEFQLPEVGQFLYKQ